MRNRVSGKIVIVSRTGQRVIQNLVETATTKLFGNQVLQFITAVSRSLIAQIRLYIVTEFHIIISVNTENILDHVDIALYINTIYRHINHQTFGSFGHDLHFQAFQNALDRFNRNHSYGVITTHYQNLKHFAKDTEGIVNGAMLYDRHLMQALFQLQIGNPGSSFAVEIARKIGLPEDVIADASEIVGSEYINADKYLQDIVRDKRYWEGKRQTIRQREKHMEETIERYQTEIEDLQKSRKEILRKAKEEVEQLMQEANARIENTIRSIKEAQAEKEKTRQARQELTNFRESMEALANKELEEKIARKMEKLKEKQNRKKEKKAGKGKENGLSAQALAEQQARKEAERLAAITPGCNVRIKGQTSVGEVMEVNGKNAVIAFGSIKTTVKLDRLERTNAQPKQADVSTKSTFISAQTQDSMYEKKLHFKQDIDVRGMRGDEDLQAVTYFIDDAILVGMSRVRILHGTGTGILRMLIRQYLETVPGVRHFADEHIQFGGAGITVVDLS